MEAMDVKYKPVMFPNGAALKKQVKPAVVAPIGAGGSRCTGSASRTTS